jgi:CheY-like chemotaxis protein
MMGSGVGNPASLFVKNHQKSSLLATGFAVCKFGALRAPTLTATKAMSLSRPSCQAGFPQEASPASVGETAAAASIYVVDDEEGLTEMYTVLLEANGYIVRAFNHRAEALAALMADRRKPDLLITDYCGGPMPVERFMELCLTIHPALRILMASGFNQTYVQFVEVKPDRFIQKPFTPEGFLQEVRAVLAGDFASVSSDLAAQPPPAPPSSNRHLLKP